MGTERENLIGRISRGEQDLTSRFLDSESRIIRERDEDILRMNITPFHYIDVPFSFLRSKEIILSEGRINFSRSDRGAVRRLSMILSQPLCELTHRITGKKTLLIRSSSNIPLIGSLAFGIIDRNTTIIEVRPSTGCNLNCIYCSVDEGRNSRKTSEFLLSPYYLASELFSVLDYKNIPVELHINGQGEPLLYPFLEEFIALARTNKLIREVSIVTNGTLLSRKKVDSLVDAGLTRLSVSLNTLSKETASRMAGTPYDPSRIMAVLEYASRKIPLIIAPVLLPGFNDDELEDVVLFSKKIGAVIGIQNFLNYRHGRNPVKSLSWEAFIDKMKRLEKKTGVNLIMDLKSDFDIKPSRALFKPLKKGDVVSAEVVLNGRMPNEYLASAKGRIITFYSGREFQRGQRVRLQITRSKYNIFFGALR